jgi:GNAT superfamily N-acetyltransferase
MPDRERVIESVRAIVAAAGVDAFPCDDFRPDDIERWTTNEGERRSLAEATAQVRAGKAEYITVRGPNGEPLSKCGITYAERPGAGVIYQFDTIEGLRSLGLGSRLLAEAERRIVARGLRLAELGVELGNVAARALYERHGYVFSHEPDASWEYLDADGTTRRHHTRLALLRKALDG